MAPYRRLKGKECSEEHVEFGETVLYKKRKGQVGKYAPQWDVGTWVGRRWGTTENIFVDKEKVIYGLTIHRKPEEERWCRERIQGATALPWEAAHDPVLHSLADHDPEERDQLPQEPSHEMSQPIPRALRIMPRDLLKYGYTRGCKPCELMAKNQSARDRVHSKQCRERIEEALRLDGDPRVARAEARKDEYCHAHGAPAHQEEGGGVEERVGASGERGSDETRA